MFGIESGIVQSVQTDFNISQFYFTFICSICFNFQIIVSLGFLYNVHQYSGVIFQVMCDHRKKNRIIPDVLAVGGRYNNLVTIDL